MVTSPLTVEELQQSVPRCGKVPVLLFGGGLTLTGVMRILARARVPFYVISSEPGLHTQSRWYRNAGSGFSHPAPQELSTFLKNLALPRAVLMPCADDWAREVAALPPELRDRFPASTSALSVVETFVDKWQFTGLLRREHIPHPRTLLVPSRQEAESMDEAEFQGRILKPVSSVHFSRKYGVKGYLVNTRAEAVAILRKISFPVMLQQYIPGPPTASFFIDGFVDRHGRVLARFARQRLRIYPDKLGNSSLMVSVALPEVAPAVESLNRLLQAAAYHGIFSAEFKYDQRDGVFKILEVNVRPWWYIEFAARCGVDVCTLAYRDALGLPQQPVQEYQVGRRCVFLANDYRAYRDARDMDGMSLWSWIASWAGADEALFRWTDPRPSLAYFVHALKPRVDKRSDDQAVADINAEHPVVT